MLGDPMQHTGLCQSEDSGWDETVQKQILLLFSLRSSQQTLVNSSGFYSSGSPWYRSLFSLKLTLLLLLPVLHIIP